ncbi:MAG TPA: cell division protein ZapA [Rhodanobacteraceae bacterium]|nr:cell division protein ZapA [Rhodanobacteraceae bacterium]
MPNDPVSIRLLDREFLVACSDEERPGLLAAASLLDGRMREMRGGTGGPGFDRIAVLVALSVAHELLNLKQRSDEQQRLLGQQLAQWRQGIDASLERDQPGS